MHHPVVVQAGAKFWQDRQLVKELFIYGALNMVVSLELTDGVWVGSHIKLTPNELPGVLANMQDLVAEWNTEPHREAVCHQRTRAADPVP